jgi:hypothetical protein
MPAKIDLQNAALTRQSYGIAMAQCTYGGPRGIWLECSVKGCNQSERIVGSTGEDWAGVTDAEAAMIFRRHGWTGDGDRMLKAKCPSCSLALENGR